MKRVLVDQTLILALVSGLLLALSRENQAISFAIGAGLSLLNLVINTVFAAWLFKGKKPVAQLATVIVFKYPLLALILYVGVRRLHASPIWIVLGICSFLLPAFVESLRRD